MTYENSIRLNYGLDFPFMTASDKKCYLGAWPAALFRHRPSPVYRSRRDGRFAGAKIVAQPGLHACRQAFRADRTAILQRAFTPVAFGLRFCRPFQWESCDSRVFY